MNGRSRRGRRKKLNPVKFDEKQAKNRHQQGGGGGKLEKRNHIGETLLHTAAKKCDAKKVKELLESGANPNVTDNAGAC